MIRVLLFALLFAVPAAADDVFMNNTTSESNMCVIGITGQTTSNPAAVARATYSPITYHCAAGTYLPAGNSWLTDNQYDNECETCPAGSYCIGGDYEFNETTAQGATGCPAGYTSSAAGSDEQSDCYRTCTTSDVAHATSVTGNVYSNGTTTCTPTVCETGYNTAYLNACVANVYNVNYAINGGHILPSGYTQVEYIQSSGTQYINTGYSPNSNTKVETKWQLLESESNGDWPMLFGGADIPDNHYKHYSLYGSYHRALFYTFGQIGNGSTGDNDITANVSLYNIDYTCVTEKNILTVNNVSYTMGTNPTFSIIQPIYLFARNREGTPEYLSSAKMYYLKIWNNGSLVRDFIPARRNSDNELGMYDMVSGNFFTNDGTGTFTAGPDTTTMPTNTYTYGTGLTENIVPIRAHGSFVGWCDDAALTSNCATPKTIGTTATGDKTFYAKYLCDTGYSTNVSNTACDANTITIDWDGYGAGNNQTQQTQCTYGGSITTPTDAPTKRGHVFTGWTFNVN